MNKTTARLLVAAVLLFTAANWFCTRKAKATPQIVHGQPACTAGVASNWGQHKGSSEHSDVVFKDSSDTLPLDTNVPSGAAPQPALTIRRSTPPN